MLQTRSAKRPAQAAVRVAVDMVEEGLLTKEEALRQIDAGKLDALLHPTFDPDFEYEPLARGVPASPGRPRARSSSRPRKRDEEAERGKTVILVRPFTEADDVAGFHAAKGHPHLRGRQGVARGARRPRDGPALRGRRLGASTSTSTRAR